MPALEGFAVQWHAPVPFHTSLTVQTGGLNPKRIPLPFIADHVWTIVIVRESTQRTEIHRYLQRLEPQQPFDDTIRLVEQSWRALEARTPLYDDEAARLLARDLDPLSLAVLGYRLALESRWPEVDAVVKRLGTVELADAHVLAALVGERDKNMELAVKSPSVPVVGEGYRADGGVAYRTLREAEHAAADRARAVHRRTVDDVRHARPGRDLEGVSGAQRTSVGDAAARCRERHGADRAGPRQPEPVHRDGLLDRTARTRVDGLHREREADGSPCSATSAWSSRRSSERQMTTGTVRSRGSRRRGGRR